MDVGNFDREKRKRVMASLMTGIVDLNWINAHDTGHRAEKFIVYLATGIEEGVMPLSIAREALIIYVKMENLTILGESVRK